MKKLLLILPYLCFIYSTAIFAETIWSDDGKYTFSITNGLKTQAVTMEANNCKGACSTSYVSSGANTNTLMSNQTMDITVHMTAQDNKNYTDSIQVTNENNEEICVIQVHASSDSNGGGNFTMPLDVENNAQSKFKCLYSGTTPPFLEILLKGEI